MHKRLSPVRGGVYDGKNVFKARRLSDFEGAGASAGRVCFIRLCGVLRNYVRLLKVDSSNRGKGGIMNNGIKKETQMLEHRRPQAVKRNHIIANGCSFVNSLF